MADFSEKFIVKASQVGPNRLLKNSALFLAIQEISIAHTEALGFPKETTLEKGLLWVIAKEHIKIIRMPRYDEEVILSTYPHQMMHSLFPRSYEIKDKNGDLLISGSAIWTLIDIKSRKIVNPLDHDILIPDLSNGRDFVMPLSNKFPIEYENDVSLKAMYSYCDLNKHLNNSSYLDLLENLLPIDYLENHEISLIDIEFLREIKLGDDFRVRYGIENGVYYFSSPSFKLKLAYRE